MKAKLIYILSLILILKIYASEVFFMPNYIERGDMWHLFEWILIFTISLGFVLILNLIFMFKKRKVNLEVLLILFLTTVFFASLNNAKSNLQEFGYIGIFLILMYYACFKLWLRYTLKKQL